MKTINTVRSLRVNLWFIALVFITVCLPSFAENELCIIPGIGVEGVIEFGMAPSNIIEQARFYHLHEEKEYWYSNAKNSVEVAHLIRVVDYGIEVSFQGYKVVHRISLNLDRGSQPCFKGVLKYGGKAFSIKENGTLTRKTIIEVFGDVENVPITKIIELNEKGKNTSTMLPASFPASEVLNYPEAGMEFAIRDGVVVGIRMYAEWKAGIPCRAGRTKGVCSDLNMSVPSKAVVNKLDNPSSATGSRRLE